MLVVNKLVVAPVVISHLQKYELRVRRREFHGYRVPWPLAKATNASLEYIVDVVISVSS